MIALLFLTLVAAPAWKVSVPKTVPSVGEISFSTYLGKGKTPPLTFVLTPKGGKTIRRPLSPKMNIARGSVYGDLRLVFGRLKPGRYTLHLERPGRVSERAVFDVIEVTLAQASKKQPKPVAGLAFTVKKGKAELANNRKTEVRVWAYRSLGPIQALVTAEYWDGRQWVAKGGGFCGTGLEQVAVAAGASAEISLPPHQDGIVRFRVTCFVGKKQVELVSKPVLIDRL